MKTIAYPGPEEWPQLFDRPAVRRKKLERQVRRIFKDVSDNGDRALRKYTRRYDGYSGSEIEVNEKNWDSEGGEIPAELKNAIDRAAENIKKFHENQMGDEAAVETSPGVVCRRENRPVDTVGLYIPGGSAPLFSTVLMLGIPAMIAGCRNIFLCTPPAPDGRIRPEMIYAAKKAGVGRIFRAGGIQAIAAMTFGTETIPMAEKIFGPGNQYVTAAKNYAQYLGTAIDMPAGPSEVLVIADATATPCWVAADLLSQAEHGPDSQVVLLTWEEALLPAVKTALGNMMEELPRREMIKKALQHARLILCKDSDAAVAMSNAYAPEHLILAVQQPEVLLKKIRHAGSVFLGHYTPESAGDYASGTNHTLPTMGYARVFGGVSVEGFLKKMTVQEITREGLENLGPVIQTMAEAEALEAHKLAVSVRLKKKNT